MGLVINEKRRPKGRLCNATDLRNPELPADTQGGGYPVSVVIISGRCQVFSVVVFNRIMPFQFVTVEVPVETEQ